MKTLAISLLCLALVSSQLALADQPPALTGPQMMKVNPESLRHRLLESNLSLVEALNSVKDAKDQVSVARGNLLPSINLGGLIASGNTFLLSSVQFLLPFLMPSNWFNYKAEKAAFEAEKLSYRILELNTYSSALSVYLTVLADGQVKKVYDEEYNDLKQIYDTEKSGVDVGLISPDALLPLQAQMQMAGVQSSTLSQLQKQEIASLRAALALPLSTDIQLEEAMLPHSPWEDGSIQAAVDQANSVAPEHQQIQYLVKRAGSQKWAAVFGFINGTTLSSQTTSTSVGASLANLTVRGNLSLGFALFPTVRIANRNIQEVKLLDAELLQSNQQVLESAMGSLIEAKNQLDLAAQAEAAMKTAWQNKVTEFQLGTATLTDVLFSRIQMADSQIARVKASLGLNLQRAVIHRALVSDQFGLVKGCDLSNVSDHKKSASLDQLCREAASN